MGDGVDVLKKLKRDAKKRVGQQWQQSQKREAIAARQEHNPQPKGGTGTSAGSRSQAGPAAPADPQNAAPARTFEPMHKYFVSQNWKNLLERKPKVAPKAAAAMSSAGGPEGRAAFDVVAIDCEMVGVGPGGVKSVLARVSVVDSEGNVVMDRFVQPKEEVTDYRTHITGITEERLQRKDVISERAAIQRAAELMAGKIVVGHALQNDFQVLQIEHDHALIRDTSGFKPLRLPDQKKTPSLKKLASYWLQESIQDGSHDSVQDARTALRLYRLQSRLWEKQFRSAMNQLSDFSGAHRQEQEEGEPVVREVSGLGTAANLIPTLGAERSAERKTDNRARQNHLAAKRKKKRAGRQAAAKGGAQPAKAGGEEGAPASRGKPQKRRREG